MDDALSALKTEFKNRGWNQRHVGQVIAELVVHVCLALGGIAIFVFCEPWWLRAIGMLISTYGSVGVGTNTHTATHYAASPHRWVNEVLTYFGYPFFLMLGATFWRHRHITLHHANPNVMGIDGDADFGPFFASTDEEVAQGSAWFLASQRYVFPCMAWLNSYLRQIGSWRHLFAILPDKRKRRLAHVADAAVMSLHIVVWFVIPSLYFPVLSVIGFNLLRIGLLGYPLYCVLAPGHYPEEALCIAKGDWRKDFVLLQTATTINFSTGPIGAFLCSGLQYQIEHHLFPGYSHTHYAKMAPLVKEFCIQNGYPYRTFGWVDAVMKTFTIFSKPKHVYPDVDALRQAVKEQLGTAS
ncbi:MAG TPA: acyl-CoA desaturase [Pseudomonadota bacterium]|nr:acyl-CoA desaturase [Pseudomonadota bacterium]HNN52283.1 acyl-CoA desaturase [Pseudomonadota bacterium]HNO67902.1 acyl-CoA desaturase [Pseudomonadota bacterium]